MSLTSLFIISFTNKNSKIIYVNIMWYITLLLLVVLGYVMLFFRSDLFLILTFSILSCLGIFILYFLISLLYCTIKSIKFRFISYKLFLLYIFKHLILISILIFLSLICKFIYSYIMLFDIFDNINNLFDTEILMWLFSLTIIQIYLMFSLKNIQKFIVIAFCRWTILIILRLILFIVCPEDYHYLLTLSLLSTILPGIPEYIHILLVKWFNLLDNIIYSPTKVYCYDGDNEEWTTKEVQEWVISESSSKNYNLKDFPAPIQKIPVKKSTFDILAILYHKPTVEGRKVLCLVTINRIGYIHELNDVRFSTHKKCSSTPVDLLIPNTEQLHVSSNKDHLQIEMFSNKVWLQRLEKPYDMSTYRENDRIQVLMGNRYKNYDPLNSSHNEKDLWLVESGFPRINIGPIRSNLGKIEDRIHPSDSRILKKVLNMAQSSTK